MFQREDQEEFRAMMRMSEETYKYILGRLTKRIKKMKTKLRPAVSPDVRLTVFLRFIGYGESQVALTHHFRLGRSTIHYIILETAQAIVDVLMREYIKVNIKLYNAM